MDGTEFFGDILVILRLITRQVQRLLAFTLRSELKPALFKPYTSPIDANAVSVFRSMWWEWYVSMDPPSRWPRITNQHRRVIILAGKGDRDGVVAGIVRSELRHPLSKHERHEANCCVTGTEEPGRDNIIRRDM